jgi:hypothetical protein
VQKLAAAFKYLTFWGRFTDFQPLPTMVGAAAIYFPEVGLILGLSLGLLNYILAAYLSPEILSVLLVAGLIVLTGGSHLEDVRHAGETISTGNPQTCYLWTYRGCLGDFVQSGGGRQHG